MSLRRLFVVSAVLLAVAVPAIYAVPPADIGRTVLFATNSIQVNRDAVITSGDLVVNAGVYDALSIGDHAVVTFSGGTYTFASISSGRGAQLLADSTTIVVTGRVNLGVETSFGATTRAGAAGSIIYVHGINGVDGSLLATPAAVVIGRAANISANIL